jgi:hypothetical protein
MPSPTTVVSGARATWGVSDCGQLMGQPTEAGLTSLEPEGSYEHFAVGSLQEGFTLAYRTPPGAADNIKYDVYESTSGIVCSARHVCRDDDAEFVKVTEGRTDDWHVFVRQTFTIPKNETRVEIKMEITNCRRPRSVDLTDVLVKRYADIDVDTGGSAGWASFSAWWDKNRDSVFTYNLDDDAQAVEGRRGHVVNMVALPSDLPLDTTFVGQMGANQYQVRDNPQPLSPLPGNRADGVGVLQWRATTFRPGETFRLNMYYEAYRAFAQ